MKLNLINFYNEEGLSLQELLEQFIKEYVHRLEEFLMMENFDGKERL